jgi:hypothetical protein
MRDFVPKSLAIFFLETSGTESPKDSLQYSSDEPISLRGIALLAKLAAPHPSATNFIMQHGTQNITLQCPTHVMGAAL